MSLISAKETKNSDSGRGLSLLLVFFSDHYSSRTISSVDKNVSPSSPETTNLFRSRSSNLILTKAQYTITICVLLLFLTLFLFTLSTFEPSSVFPAVSPRRFLLNRDFVGAETRSSRRSPSFALQGMGTLFLRGTKSMQNLVVAHVASDTTEDDLRLFMRLLHRSGVTSRSDIVLLFNSPSLTSKFSDLIKQEKDSFLKLVDVHRNSNSSNQIDPVWGFNLTRFIKKQSKKESSEPIWGKKSHRANHNASATNGTGLTHGSVVAFDVTELDPENSLSGFMDHVPISLRRWACYPMLLGRVRRNFKHVMLVDAKTILFVGDPLTRIQNRSPESILFFSSYSKHNKKSSEINPAILIGGGKGIRRLSSAMHTEIVKATMQQHKKRNFVSELVVLSQLVGNVYMRKNFDVITSESVVPEASSVAELRTKNSVVKKYDIIQRGNNKNYEIIMKRICLSKLDSSVYNYC